MGDDSYLIVSNAQNGDDDNPSTSTSLNPNTISNNPDPYNLARKARTHSVVYRWQGVEKFVPVHYLDTFPSADWETFSVDGNTYLVYANAKNNISQMYRVKVV